MLLRAELKVNASTELPQLASGFLENNIFYRSVSRHEACDKYQYFSNYLQPVIYVCAQDNLADHGGGGVGPS